MNFGKDRNKAPINPWLVLFLMLAALAVVGVCKP
jgi:hypothetical protein